MTATALKTCPNCSTSLHGDEQYCPQCSQTTHLHRFSLGHIGHELMHALTHADKGALDLLKELAVRPGVVAREYVLEGKRKRYFNPFTFLMIVLGITLFVNSVFHPYTQRSSTAPPPATTRSESATQSTSPSEFRERQRDVQTFIEKRNNVVVFLAIPFFALFYWLFFLRSGINYAEHLVAQVFFSGFYSLVTLALLAPLKPLFTTGQQLGGVQLLLQFLYLSFAYYQFLGPSRSWRLVKAIFSTLLAIIAWIVVSSGIVYLYVRYGG